jgi:hypothetical protein
MNIWDIYQFNLVRLNKHQSGRTITPEEFNIVAEMLNWVYFKVKLGLPEQYQPGMPFPPQAWQVSQKITDDLANFIVWMGGPDHGLLKIDKYGIAEIPSDYVAFSSSYYDVTEQVDCSNIKTKHRAVEFLTDALFADRQQSVIKEPTKLYPVAKWIGNGKIKFAPIDLKFVNFTYLREPQVPVLGYTIDANNDIVYDPTTSTQFEWPQICLTDLANLIFEIMSQNIKSQLDIEMAVQRKISGQ